MAITGADVKIRFSSDGADKVTGDINRVGGAVEGADKKGRGFVGTMSQVAGGFVIGNVITKGTGAILGFGNSLIQSSASMELYRGQLEIATGSQQKANKIFEDTRRMAKDTPFEFPELIEGAANLEALGMASEKWMPIIADTAAGTNKSIDQTVQAVLDAGSGEFERLKEFGIRTKVEGDKVKFSFMQNGKEMVVEAENTQEGITNALMGIWDQKYDGAMEKFANTFTGRMSTLTDNIRMRAQDLFAPIFTQLSTGVARLNEFFDQWDTEGFGAAFRDLAIDVGEVAVNVAGWVVGQIPDIWNWFTGTAVPAMGAGLVALGNIAVDVAGWALSEGIPDLWDWLKRAIVGGHPGDGTGGPMGPGGANQQLSLGDVMVSVGGWVKGAIEDISDDIQAWIGEPVVHVEGATVYVGPLDIQFEDPDPSMWTSKDVWLGKPGTPLRSLIEGEPASFSVLGAEITVGLPTLAQDWGDINTDDFWLGKPGSPLRALIDGEPATFSIAGAKITVGIPELAHDWSDLTTDDFWLGKPGTPLRDLYDGESHTFSVGGAKITIGIPQLAHDWGDLTTMDFWFGKKGTWLRDVVDKIMAGENFEVPGPNISIGMPDIDWPDMPEPPGWMKRLADGQWDFWNEGDKSSWKDMPVWTGSGTAKGEMMGFAPIKLTVTADTGQAAEAIGAVEAVFAGLDGSTSTVRVLGDNAGALAAVSGAEGALGGIAGRIAQTYVNGDNSSALGSVLEAAAAMAGFDGTVATGYLEAVNNVGGAVADAINQLNAFDGKTATAYINVVGSGIGSRIPGFAEGGFVRSPLAMVGEEGPELVSLPYNSYVHNAGETSRMLAGGQGGGGGDTHMHLTIDVHGNVYGVDDLAAEVAGPLFGALAEEQRRYRTAMGVA